MSVVGDMKELLMLGMNSYPLTPHQHRRLTPPTSNPEDQSRETNKAIANQEVRVCLRTRVILRRTGVCSRLASGESVDLQWSGPGSPVGLKMAANSLAGECFKS